MYAHGVLEAHPHRFARVLGMPVLGCISVSPVNAGELGVLLFSLIFSLSHCRTHVKMLGLFPSVESMGKAGEVDVPRKGSLFPLP